MIRAIAVDRANGKRTLVVGLGVENFERLRGDKPIRIDLREMEGGGGSFDSLLIFDATDPEAVEALIENATRGR